MSAEPVVTVAEATPAEARAMTLHFIDLAAKADSLDHMLMHLKSAEIWAAGATWPALPEYDPDTDPLRGDAEARARDDAYWAPVERETS